jgi:hypothetical protein
MAYEQKFAGFIRLLANTEGETVIVSHPQVLGDTHEEIVESLNRLADAKKSLQIVPTKDRQRKD